MTAQLNDIAQIWWQWMAGMFWQVSLFIILITLLDMVIRRWAWPQVRYVLWGLVFIKLIIPPTWQMPTSIISWIQPKVEEQISVRIETREWAVEEMQLSASSISAQKQDKGPIVIEKPTWQAIVFLTWIAGIMAFAMMLIIKMSRLPKQSQMQENSDTPAWFHELLFDTAQRLKLRKAPTVVFSKAAKSPAVYGIFSPILLLPNEYLDQLSEEQAEHILIHELCHLKRGDLLVHWFCLILQIIYWFNPLLIWTRRQMRHVCEICCDLSVANLLREKTIAYRDTLLAIARELLTETVEPSLGLLGVFEEPFRLVPRLKWLEKKTWENRKRKIAATICTGLIMVVCVMPMAGLSKTTQQTEDKGSIKVVENLMGSDSAAHRKGSMPDEYMVGVEYESDENLSSNIGSVTRYDTLIIEVDREKELDLDAEPIGPPLPGSQIEEDDHYTVRTERRGVYPGNQTDEGDHYDIERVEVLRGPQDTPDSNWFRAAFSTTVIDSYPKENGSGSPVKKSDSPTVSIYAEGEIAEPPDLPPNAYMSARGAVTTENPFSIGLFKDDITIDGESFPDIEAVFESIKTETGVNILGTPRTITLDDEEIKMSWNMAYYKTSTVALGIRSRVINGGGVQKMILLNISPPNDEKSKEHTLMTLAASLTQIEDGGAMVMIVSPMIGDAKAEQDNTSGKKLYVFLTPHFENS